MKKSLRKRIEKENISLSRSFPVSRMPISHYYLGAAILSKKQYFKWIYNKILEHDVPENWKMESNELDITNMVDLAYNIFELTDMDEILEEEEDKIGEDYRLMYQLIIEPFYEIYREEGDKKYGKTNDCERNI